MKKTFWPDGATPLLLDLFFMICLSGIFGFAVYGAHHVSSVKMAIFLICFLFSALCIIFKRYLGRIEIDDGFVSGPAVGRRQRLPKNGIIISEKRTWGLWKYLSLQHKNETIYVHASYFKPSTLEQIESLLRT